LSNYIAELWESDGHGCLETVRGCPLAVIMILDYGYKMHTYMSYAKHQCMYQSDGQQHAL
jgi:hypothetical protein